MEDGPFFVFQSIYTHTNAQQLRGEVGDLLQNVVAFVDGENLRAQRIGSSIEPTSKHKQQVIKRDQFYLFVHSEWTNERTNCVRVVLLLIAGNDRERSIGGRPTQNPTNNNVLTITRQTECCWWAGELLRTEQADRTSHPFIVRAAGAAGDYGQQAGGQAASSRKQGPSS